jgi:hypothetical protein
MPPSVQNHQSSTSSPSSRGQSAISALGISLNLLSLPHHLLFATCRATNAKMKRRRLASPAPPPPVSSSTTSAPRQSTYPAATRNGTTATATNGNDHHLPPARRQPRTSCTSCVRRKIKCDRALASNGGGCGGCLARGIGCSLAELGGSRGGSVGAAGGEGLGVVEANVNGGGGNGSVGGDDLGARLRRLEEAVFGSSNGGAGETGGSVSASDEGEVDVEEEEATSDDNDAANVNGQAEPNLDYQYAGSAPHTPRRQDVATASSSNPQHRHPSRSSGTSASSLYLPEIMAQVLASLDDRPRVAEIAPRHNQHRRVVAVVLPPRQTAHALLGVMRGNWSELPRVVHPEAMGRAIDDLYSRLEGSRSQATGSSRLPSEMASSLALLLAVIANGAFFWAPGASSSPDKGTLPLFPSAGSASSHALLWRTQAGDVLHLCSAQHSHHHHHHQQSRRLAGRHSRTASSSSSQRPAVETDDNDAAVFESQLREVQARVVLCDSLYSAEGCSPAFRHVASSGLIAARVAGLHMLDAPGRQQRAGGGVSEFQKEMARRTWWWLVGSDW